MSSNLMLATTSIALIWTPAFAAPCRNAQGKFIKCAIAAPAKSTRCKAANGKFAKRGTPGAKPM